MREGRPWGCDRRGRARGRGEHRFLGLRQDEQQHRCSSVVTERRTGREDKGARAHGPSSARDRRTRFDGHASHFISDLQRVFQSGRSILAAHVVLMLLAYCSVPCPVQ